VVREKKSNLPSWDGVLMLERRDEGGEIIGGKGSGGF